MASQRRDTGGEVVGECQQAEKGPARPAASAAQETSGRPEASEWFSSPYAERARDGKSGPRPPDGVPECRAETPSNATDFRH